MSQLIKQLEMIGQSADKRYANNDVQLDLASQASEHKAIFLAPEESNKAVFFVNQ